jgi:hypothetical protein
VRQKAEELAKTMGKQKLSVNNEWFKGWKKRENIVYKRVHGEEKVPIF